MIRYIQQQFARTFYRDPAEGDVPPDYVEQTNPLPKTAADVDAGKQTYTRECMVCHGDAGRGEGPYRTDLEPLPPDFARRLQRLHRRRLLLAHQRGSALDRHAGLEVQYDGTARWQLVHYIRSIFTQTEKRPKQPKTPEGDLAFEFPESYKGRTWPADTSYEGGKAAYVRYCAHCHGLAGDGRAGTATTCIPSPPTCTTRAPS